MNHAPGRHLREWGLLSVLLLGFLLLAQHGAWFERLDNGLYDIRVTWTGRPAPPDIVILAIDEASLARIGRWPWSRHELARGIEQLTQAGAGPVLVDVILAEAQQGDPSADTHLAAGHGPSWPGRVAGIHARSGQCRGAAPARIQRGGSSWPCTGPG